MRLEKDPFYNTIWIMSTKGVHKGCQSIILINTPPPTPVNISFYILIDTRSTPPPPPHPHQHLILNPDWYSVNTQSALDQHAVSQQSAEWRLAHMHRSKLSWLSTKMSMECWSWVSTEVLLECWLSIDQGYWPCRVFINTWLHMPLIQYMILLWFWILKFSQTA